MSYNSGKAMPPEAWDGPDSTRPLLQRGVDQSLSVAHGIAAYRPARLISSTAERCLRTIAPTARVAGLEVREESDISQDAYRSDAARVERIVGKRLKKRATVVLCSHGPVLPQIISAVARATGTADSEKLHRAAALSTGEYAVLHIPFDHPESGIVAVEVHSPTV